MPGGSVIKIVRTHKKWTYIARKQNIQLTKKQQQDTKHRKTTAYTETTKHENEEKAIAGN
jgi:hypothetical protein